jgi:hypothetical protein
VPPMPLESTTYVHGYNCHGRGRGFEPRRPRHTFQSTYRMYGTQVTTKSGHDMGTISAYRALTAIAPDSIVPTGAEIVPAFETIILTTLLCAARLFEFTACV